MVRQAVRQRSRHFRVTEDTGPFTEGEISGDDDRGALVYAADQVEQQLTTRLSEGQIAQFVEDDEVEACKVIGHATLFAATGLGLQPVHQIDNVEEAPACGLPRGYMTIEECTAMAQAVFAGGRLIRSDDLPLTPAPNAITKLDPGAGDFEVEGGLP